MARPYDERYNTENLIYTDVCVDFEKKVQEVSPDLIVVSCTEDMWELGIKILDEIKKYKSKKNIPVVAGGVFPTFAPEICIKNDLIDIVCVGEGENALIDLCDKIKKKKDYTHVTNLWVKEKDGTITKNGMSDPVDVNAMPTMDINLFDEQRLHRPMAGKWYKMLPIETMRGCPYKCTYCNYEGNNRYNHNSQHTPFRLCTARSRVSTRKIRLSQNGRPPDL